MKFRKSVYSSIQSYLNYAKASNYNQERTECQNVP